MMTDTPFWKRTPADPECEPQTSAEPTVSVGDVLTIGEHEFIRTKGTAARVAYKDDDGKDLGSIYIPYDSDDRPSEDDVFAEADRFYHDMEHMRTVVNENVVAQLAADIHSSGTADNMIRLVAEGLAGSLSLTFSDDDETPPEQREALATEASRLFDEKLPELIRDALDPKGDPIEDFWHQFARDILATALLRARDDTTEELGGPEAVETLDDETFEAQVLETYRNGPYITGTMLELTHLWTTSLYEVITTTMSGISELDFGKELVDTLLTAARKSLGMETTPAIQTPPIATPAFNTDGYGRTDNSVVAIGARRALSADRSRWHFDVEGFPVFTHENGSGKALYSPSRSHFPTTRDAMRAVEDYGPAHVAMLKYITALHLANSANKNQRPVWGLLREH